MKTLKIFLVLMFTVNEIITKQIQLNFLTVILYYMFINNETCISQGKKMYLLILDEFKNSMTTTTKLENQTYDPKEKSIKLSFLLLFYCFPQTQSSLKCFLTKVCSIFFQILYLINVCMCRYINAWGERHITIYYLPI